MYESLLSTSVQSEHISQKVFDISSFEMKHQMHRYVVFV